jgi:extradiol dioxygenase family protein
MQIGNTKLAIVSPQQHPPHVAVKVDEAELNEAAKNAKVSIDTHRDGTKGIYIHDPFGNAVELICYPSGETIYDKN